MKNTPLKVDRALQAHFRVKKAICIAVPYPTLGEEVAAAITLHEPDAISEAELRGWVGERLAHHKVSRRIELRDELPKGAVGKVNRKDLVAVFDLLDDSAKEASEVFAAAGMTPLEAVYGAYGVRLLSKATLALMRIFFSGGDFLVAIQLVLEVEKIFGLRIGAE